jgi:hypothetical protein
MHPDRRRAGRAIRKQRRLERESYFARKDRETEYILSGQFGRDLKALGEAALRGFQQLADALAEVARQWRQVLETTHRQNQLALPPAPGALRRSDPTQPYPTHSGGEALRSPRGASAPLGWIDEAARIPPPFPPATFDKLLEEDEGGER